MVKRPWMAFVDQKLDISGLNSLGLCCKYILPSLFTTRFAVFANDQLPRKHKNRCIYFLFMVVTESVNRLKPNGNYMYHICNVRKLLFGTFRLILRFHSDYYPKQH
jgi:hypothetical protein